MSIAQSRDQIRKQIIEKRNALTPELMQHFSKQITAHFLGSKIYKNANHIVCYLTTMSEVDCHQIIEQIFLDHKKCYLPVVDPNKKGQMYFVEHGQNDKLIKNKFGILEPENKKAIVDISALDIILAPLVAYDLEGNRLGMGAGYYDRALEKLKPIYCGLAYRLQEVEKIKKESWDVPLSYLINEAGLLVFKV